MRFGRWELRWWWPNRHAIPFWGTHTGPEGHTFWFFGPLELWRYDV